MPEFCKHHIHESMYCGSCYKEALKNANARIASLEVQLEEAEKVIHFTHTHLKSMDGYSLVNGVRFMAQKYFEEKEKNGK